MPSPDQAGGAQRERTSLAWQRSASSFAGLGAVVLGVAAHRDAPGLLALSALLVAVAQPRALAALTLLTALAALAAMVTVLVRL